MQLLKTSLVSKFLPCPTCRLPVWVLCPFLLSLLALHVGGPVLNVTQGPPEGADQHPSLQPLLLFLYGPGSASLPFSIIHSLFLHPLKADCGLIVRQAGLLASLVALRPWTRGKEPREGGQVMGVRTCDVHRQGKASRASLALGGNHERI